MSSQMLRPLYTTTLLIAIVIGACTSQEFASEQSPVNKIIYGLSITVSGIDPHINQSTELGIVLRQVYDTLLYRHPETLEFVPGLAQSWEVSDDGLEYTFSLRQDVVFHDGEPFNANAVGANISRIMDPDTASQRARLLLGPLVRYQILDEFTIRLQLSEPFAPLLDGLSQVYTGIASPRALAEYSNLRYQFHQVGTGPFIFEEYLPEDRIVIRRNPNYTWGPQFYQIRGGDIPENAVDVIEFRFFTDATTRGLALENGSAQVMGELPPLSARAINNDARFRLAPVLIPGQPLQFYFNTRQFPTDDLAVRRALIVGVNRFAIVDAVYGGFSPVAWGPLTSNTLFYNPNVEGLYSYNIEQARNLLESAGYTDSNNDGFLDKDGETLEIRLIQPPWGGVPEVVQFLRDQWQNLGVRVIVQPVSGYSALIEAIQGGNFNLVSFDSPSLDPSVLNERFLSNGTVNWTGYGSTELDNLLKEASRQSRPELRAQLYAQIQIIIMREALILPIRDYVNLNAYSVELSPIMFDPYGWFPLMNDVVLTQQDG